jgi:hypothetical protein
MPVTRLVWPAFTLATVLFYSILLFSPQATIHWDLADVTYPVQRYVAETLRSGTLPHWTPFLFSGTPLLADPQAGVWYPPHWPFFLIGITPRAVAWEIALHGFIALAGAYLLIQRLLGQPLPAALGAMIYAWGGVFATRSSQLAQFEAAALFPWLLWAALVALEAASRRYIALPGFFGGLIVLTGDFDSAAYCCFGFVCFVLCLRRAWKRTAVVTLAAAAITVLLGAIAILPWLELSNVATRAGVPRDGASLVPGALLTLLSPDHYGLFSRGYSGPGEIRQYYFYAGLLGIPLAVAGMIRRVRIAPILGLTLPAIWYAFGPSWGLARVLGAVPALRGARAPVEIWFVAALGVAIAAASGAIWIVERLKRNRLQVVLLVLCAADLWFWNFYRNPLVLARVSFEELYGKRQALFEQRVADASRQPMHRIWASSPPGFSGPLNGPLLSRTEVTYGSGLPQLNRYAEYLQAALENARLLNGLAATHTMGLGRDAAVEANPAALPRISTPPAVTVVSTAAEARARLALLDPAQAAIVEASVKPAGSGPAQAEVAEYRGGYYRIRYTAAADSFLRIAVPFHAGWRATIDGRAVEIIPTDYALSGVAIPAGTHELLVEFQTGRFHLGTALSLTGIVLILLAFLL